MKSAFAVAAAVLSFAAGALAQGAPLVNTPTPSPPVCQPLLITWSGGTPPYFLSILPGNEPGAAALIDFGQVTGTSLTWTVNITAGTSLGLTLRDNTGQVSQSAPFTVADSSNTACLNAGSSSSSSSSGSTSSSTGPTSSSTRPTSVTSSSSSSSVTSTPTTPSTSHSSSSSTSHSSAASSAASNTPSSAASIENVQMGLVGALGAALVAILA